MISISSLTLGRHGIRPEGLRDLLKGHTYVVRIRIQELHGKMAGQGYLRMVVTVLHVPVMTLTTRYFWGPRRSEEDRSSSRATIHEAHASTRRAPPCFSILNLQLHQFLGITSTICKKKPRTCSVRTWNCGEIWECYLSLMRVVSVCRVRL